MLDTINKPGRATCCRSLVAATVMGGAVLGAMGSAQAGEGHGKKHGRHHAPYYVVAPYYVAVPPGHVRYYAPPPVAYAPPVVVYPQPMAYVPTYPAYYGPARGSMSFGLTVPLP